jgi:uncharacterized protein YbjQ (UPF0145 family)
METSLSSGVDKDHPELTIEFSHNGNYTRARYATIGDAIDTLYKKAVDMGADGIINLNLNFKDNAVHLPEITATGMAIKRK